jgi:hypothetical protein
MPPVTTESLKSPEPKKADEPKPAPAGKLGRAAESSDPAVHQAMAVLQGAQMNRDALDVEKADIDAADKQVADAKKALADLGYE